MVFPGIVLSHSGAEHSVDILYCEVLCPNSIQRAWCILKELDNNRKNRSDEMADQNHVSIVAVRDDFVVYRGRPCGRVVISLDDYLATVFFLEAKLSGIDAGLGDVCHLAEQIGLLDDVKPQSWEVVKTKTEKASWFRRAALMCTRVLAGTASGNLSQHVPYFFNAFA